MASSRELQQAALRLGGVLMRMQTPALASTCGSSLLGTTSCWPRSTAPAVWLLRGAQQQRYFAGLPAHTVLTMPSLSPTMSQGNIAAWKKKEGDTIAPGQVIAEVETDKATIDWESQEDGFMAKILVPDGAKDLEIGTPLAIMVEEQESIAAFKDYKAGDGDAPKKAAASPAKEESAEEAPAKAAPAKDASKPAAKAAPKKPAATSYPPHTMMTMPALSPTMNQGNIVAWQKKVGDLVAPGDIYCEVETDKATITWDSQEDGYVAAILKGDNSKDIPIGTPVMVLVEEKESVAAFANFKEEDASPQPGSPTAEPSGEEEKSEPPVEPPPPSSAATSSSSSSSDSESKQAAPKQQTSSSGGRIAASPYARKLAGQSNVSLEGLTGTGPGGRIVAADVEAAVKAGKTGSKSAAAAAPSGMDAAAAGAPAKGGEPAASGEQYTDVKHSQIKRITASRLLESKQTIPHYYLSMEVQVDAMLKLREQINSSGSAGVKISVNDFIVKASALALKKVSGVNAAWHPDFVRNYSNVDISVAVQTPQGLMVPIVKDADKKGLATISADVKALAAKAKDGKLTPAEFTGGTFTISNLGMYGIKQFAAIINPPQAAILAVGGTDKKVVLNKAGSYEQVTTLVATMSCDHRVIDGAMGAEWMQAFKGYLENPYTMLL